MGPFGAVVLAVALLSVILPGVHRETAWLNFGNRLGEHTFTLGLPIVGAFACWLGGTDTRAGTTWLGDAAARRPLAWIMDGLAPAVLWPLAGYATATVIGLLTVLQAGLQGAFPFDAVASNGASLIAVACVGYALGRVIPLRAAAPLTGLAVVALCAGGLGEVLGITEGFARQTYTGPDVPRLTALYGTPTPSWLPWLVTACFLAVGAAAVLLSARRWVLAALVLMLVIPVKLWLAVSPTLDGDQRMAPAPVELACAGSGPRVCVGADAADGDDHLAERARQVAKRLAGVRGTPTHYVITATFPLTEGYLTRWPRGEPWPVTAMVGGINEGPNLSLESELARELMWQAAMYRCDSELDEEVYNWLVPPELGRLTFYYLGEPPSETSRLAVLPRRERIAWLNSYFNGPDCPPALARHRSQHVEAAP